MKRFERFLLVVSEIGEYYWIILFTILAIAASIALYFYYSNHQELLIWVIIATLVLVLGPPAFLMCSYILASLFNLCKRKIDGKTNH